MKIIKIVIAALIGLVILAAIFYAFWLSPRYTVPILTYHYFGYEKQVPIPFVTPENFEKQMRYLKEKSYRVISLDTLVEGLKKGRKFPHNTIVITIDDGHQSIYTYAYPVLKKYGFCATVFLISDYVGIKEGFLNWDQVKEMSRNNISFGGHTKNHVYLPSIKNDKDILWNEIAGCKKAIEGRLGIPVDYFCYPSGGLNEEIEMFVKQAGYKGACATNRGSDIFNRHNFYGLIRVSARNTDPYFSFSNLCKPLSFRSRLSGYYNIFREQKRGD
jgi:peptidoglycan/xylan/chitin deacetylase (PgdA/CDA1 family)